MIKSRNDNPDTFGIASKACVLAAIAALMLPAMLFSGGDAPVIHDIATDPNNPPQFDVVVGLRGSDSNPLHRSAEAQAELVSQQLAGYPNLKTLQTSDMPSEAFEKALAIAKNSGWEIVNQDSASGLIEAVDTTLIFGFKDDVAIRIRPSAQGSDIDLRSVSRIGESDLGKNAARIMGFIEAY